MATTSGPPPECYLRYEIRYTGGEGGGARYAYQIVIVLSEIPIEFFVKMCVC